MSVRESENENNARTNNALERLYNTTRESQIIKEVKILD